MDHIAESNVNRQIHALSQTLGQSKIEAMAARISCEGFVTVSLRRSTIFIECRVSWPVR
jgi:tRNA A37 threonylcarbamoyladenosine dehydratase